MIAWPCRRGRLSVKPAMREARIERAERRTADVERRADRVVDSLTQQQRHNGFAERIRQAMGGEPGTGHRA